MNPADPPPSLLTARRAALVFIFITVVLDVLALGIIVPVLPGLVRGFLGGDTSRGAEYYGWFGTVWAAMQFGFAPVLGALSDRFGRRPVILLSNFGLGLDYVLMALAPNLGWLFVGRVVSGITAASFPTAGAYIADVTPPEKRAAGYGMLGAAFGLGFVLGPALGGVLGNVNPRLPFWTAAALSLANACYGLFVLPESLPPGRRAAFSWRKANPVAALDLLRSHGELLGLAASNVLGFLAHEVFPSVYVIYAGYRFGWNPREMGLALAGAGVCGAVVQGGLTRPVVARLGERGALFTGLVFGVLGFLLYGWAWRGEIFLLAIPLAALWGLAAPPAQSMMSRRVEASEQGRLQGANSSLRGITGMIGPVLFTSIFAAFIPGGRMARAGWQVPGAPFYLSSLLLCGGLLVAVAVTTRRDDVVIDADRVPAEPPAFTSEVP